ncbi:MAG: putative Ig domain-containing protein [Aquimonas sp.]|nr:putative Ig domain-containing protein [Aquimonas sp.]
MAAAGEQQVASLGPPTQFIDPDFGLFEAYGLRSAGQGDRFVVGAPFAFPRERVDIFTRSGESWSLETALLSPDGEGFDAFGDAVLLAENYLFISATEHLSASGSVYVFEQSGGQWTFRQRLRASDAASNVRFGRSLAGDGQTLIVGADGANQSRGAVYVFSLNAGSWQQSQRLSLANGAQNDRFGFAVAFDGDRLIAGAPGRDQPTADQGAAYIFRRQSGVWGLEASLLRPDASSSDQLGRSVAMSGSIAVAGAPFAESDGPSNAGVIMTWQLTGSEWIALAELSSPEASINAQFGDAVSLLGPRLLVGLPGDAVAGGLSRGSAELFLLDGNGWERRERVILPNGAAEDLFGSAVVLSENFAGVGAPGTNLQGQVLAGAAYAYVSRASQIDLAGTPASARIGQPFAATATVETVEITATGTVRVRDELGTECTVALQAGSGSCQLLASAVGLRTLRARYDGAPGVSESFGERQIQVIPDLSISPTTLPRAQIGRSYSAGFSSPATGATAPLTWSLASGALPPDVTLAPDGSLSGTPSAFGSFNFSVTVTDSSGAELGGPFSESRAYTLEVDPPFTTQLTLLDPVSVGDRGQSRTFTAQLAVVEDGASAPGGNFAVSASNGGTVLSCSAPVIEIGQQSCSIAFGSDATVGDYVVSAVFVSNSAEMGGSSAGGSYRVFSPADPTVAVEALDPIYLPEQPLRHRIRVENLGPDTAFQVSLGSSLSPSIGPLQWTCSGAACPTASGSGLPNLVIPALPAASAVEFNIEGVLGENVPLQVDFAASVSLLPAGFSRELDAGNNASSITSLPARLFGDGFEAPSPP